MNYKDFLSSEPYSEQEFPYNTIEFFDDEKMVDAYYVNHKKLKREAEDDVAEIVDSYLNDNPEVTRAVVYRVEGPHNRYAYREFGQD